MTQELMTRMMSLEQRLSHEERAKVELREKLMISEANFREISNFL